MRLPQTWECTYGDETLQNVGTILLYMYMPISVTISAVHTECVMYHREDGNLIMYLDNLLLL